MTSRASELITALDLKPHPEGGAFSQIFRSEALVLPDDGRGPRTALTVIYFLLVKGAKSRWHRVRSDEVWHFCEGEPIELWTVAPGGGEASRVQLGPFKEAAVPVHIVPAGFWQAARPLGSYGLVSCVVGPGFDFADFDLLSSSPGGVADFIPVHLRDQFV